MCFLSQLVHKPTKNQGAENYPVSVKLSVPEQGKNSHTSKVELLRWLCTSVY